MKIIIYGIVLFFNLALNAQKSQFVEIEGSKLSLLKYQNFTKSQNLENGFKIINTETGNVTKIELANTNAIQDLLHVKIDSLNLNQILVLSQSEKRKFSHVPFTSKIQTYTLDGNLLNSIEFDEKMIRDFTVNKITGALIINFDRIPVKEVAISENEILILDLKTLIEIKRI